MARRGKMSSGHSKSNFRRGAQNVHRKNTAYEIGPMRGGIRL